MNMTSKQREKLTLTGILLTVGFIHMGSLDNGLVADDWVFVYPHTLGESLGYFFRSIIPPEWESLWLRPIPMLFFWVGNILWPGTTWGPHLVNVLFHVANTYLIWKMIRLSQSGAAENGQGLPSILPSLTASLIYGLHPLTVGSVGWVSARFDVMSITFGLAGLYLWMCNDSGRPGKRAFTGAAAMFMLSLLSKEQGVVFLGAGMLAMVVRLLSRSEDRRKSAKELIILGALFGCYLIYRLIIFGGMGGYLTAQHGLNPLLPLYYLAAVLLPFPNVISGWSVSWTLVLSIITFGAVIAIQWNLQYSKMKTDNRIITLIASLLFLIGLITTAPHAGLLLDQVMGHSEARFALIPVTGFALLVGIYIRVIVTSTFMHRTVLILALCVGSLYLWRSDVQIQSWKQSGIKAESILDQTLELVPDPPINSTIIYIDIPRNNAQYAYIFGIGLKEAVRYRYGCREDINVIRYAKRRDMQTADPDRDSVLQYHKDTGVLEKLRAVRQKRTNNQ
ncbi:hypothetical protein ACFL47_01385 [Candidatus Latescibacterota bacterium]